MTSDGRNVDAGGALASAESLSSQAQANRAWRMPRLAGPLLTRALADQMLAARAAGETVFGASFDLGRTIETVLLEAEGWSYRGTALPWPVGFKDRTVYISDGDTFAPLQRYRGALIKLVPTEWGPPTFEIDGIKMLPTSKDSPYADAQRKVALIAPRGKRVLDTCGGLGYFAACCLADHAAHVLSVEKNADVLWLREHNPWSPDSAVETRLELVHDDVVKRIATLPDQSFDAALHDPPRFGIAGELYAQTFYDELARVLRPDARLFHYTGTPNMKTSGRDVPGEVAKRLQKSGFVVERALDGVYAIRRKRHRR